MKKRILSGFLSSLIVLGFYGTLAMFSDNDSAVSWGQTACGNVDVVLAPATAEYNETVEVCINISGNQCLMRFFGFDLFFDTSMFSYQGISGVGCLTADWSLLDGNEISSGQVRIGGISGIGTDITATQNGTLVKVNLLVIGHSGSHSDGDQSSITVNAYLDGLVAYTPQPSSGIFTLIVSSGDISLPTSLSGNWGDVINIPAHIANNTSQVSDFKFDFVYDPLVIEIRDVERTSAIQNWTTLNWTQVSSGRIRVTGQAGSGTSLPASSDQDFVNVKVQITCVSYGVNTYVPFRIEAYQDGISTLYPKVFSTNLLYYPCPRLGDVNGDGNVTPGDAQIAFEIFLGQVTPSRLQLTTADANSGCPCDGLEHEAANNCITPGDAQWIFEHYLVQRTLPGCSADYTCPGSSAAEVSLLAHGPPHAKKISIYPLSNTGKAGELVIIPIMVSNTEGIRKFGFDLIFPQETLDYIGTLASPLTQGFEEINGEEMFPGIIRIQGADPQGITARIQGSLCVVVFQVKDNVWGTSSLELGNLNDDLYAARTKSGIFRVKIGDIDKGSIHLGQAFERSGRLIVPVEVFDLSEVKAFSLEFAYPEEKLDFLGIKQTRLSQDYISVAGNEIGEGLIRVGGYGSTGLQDRASGEFLRLVFKVKESGAEIELLKAEDDLKGSLLY